MKLRSKEEHRNRKDDSMPSKLDHAAEVLGDAVGAVEVATATAGKRVKQGLSEAAATIGSSRTAERVEQRLDPTRKAVAKKVARAKKASKKRVASVKRKAVSTKKTAKAGTARAKRKAVSAKKSAHKKAAPAKRKAPPAA